MAIRDPLRDKSPTFIRWIGGPWLRRRMRRAFFSIEISGIENLHSALSASQSRIQNPESRIQPAPLILYSNHCSWWDGFVDFTLAQLYHCDLHVMMDQQNLDLNPFLRWMGAFGVNLESPARSAPALRAARRILDAPPTFGENRALSLYAQGRMTSPHERPLALRPGLAWLLKNVAGCAALPMARRYEFMNEDRPQIFLRFGPPTRSSSLPELAALLEKELDGLQHQLARWPAQDFTRVWQADLSLNKKWERWRRKWPGRDAKSFQPFNR